MESQSGPGLSGVKIKGVEGPRCAEGLAKEERLLRCGVWSQTQMTVAAKTIDICINAPLRIFHRS